MMSERTALITARRESEDNLVKTIIQLASALIALLAGFASQSNFGLSGNSLLLFGAVLAFLGLSIVGGLMEHFFASKAYEEQQKLVEDFYQKIIYEFGPAPSNVWVRKSQIIAFIAFVLALISLGSLALVKAGESNAKEGFATTPTARPVTSVDAARTIQGGEPVGGALNATAPSPIAKEMSVAVSNAENERNR